MTARKPAPKPVADLSGIQMPDHPVRHTALYQMFDRMWRPACGWATVAGLVYALVVGPWIGKPLGEGYLLLVLTFAGGMLGLKTFEKNKGIA